MPLAEAMRTQRAIRRVKPDPVPDDLLMKCLELATRAPTGGNAQNWAWILVRDPEVKAKLARLYRQSWRFYGAAARKRTQGHARMERVVDSVQWQVDHFEEIPVLVVACLRGRTWMTISPWGASSHYGSIYPAIQNFLLACRA